MMLKLSLLVLLYLIRMSHAFQPVRLQGVAVRGKLICGNQSLHNAKVKIVDVDQRPDMDDLMGEVNTDKNGLFKVSGATREDSDIEVVLKIYHDCLDEFRPCQRKAWWNVPAKYYNNGTVAEWFDVGTINMELGFPQEERDCRH